MYKARDSQAGDCIECCKLVEHSFGVPDGVRSFQDSRVCISVALLPKLVMLPGRDASLSEDDADRGAFFLFWRLLRCSLDATLMAGVCVCCEILVLTSSGVGARFSIEKILN